LEITLNGCSKLWSSGSREIGHSAVCWSCSPEQCCCSCSSHGEARKF